MNAHSTIEAAPIEEWRAVADWPYLVSNLGRVKRVGHNTLADRPNGNGYFRVTLCNDRLQRTAYVHRLVCAAFHGAPSHPDMHADHIDGTRANNAAENLRWLMPSETRALRKFAKGERSGVAKLTDDAVRSIRSAPATTSNFELGERFGVAKRTISDARRGKLWRHVDA